jgi:hypothetical protein
MILCEEPWYNEPGREAGYSNAPGGPSDLYNRKIREHTVRHALLEWLDKPPPLWQDVVDQHFKQNGNAILKTVEEWATAKEVVKGPARGGIDGYYDETFMHSVGRGQPVEAIGAMLGRLNTSLKGFGATFEVKYIAPPVAPQASRPPPTQPNAFPPGLELDGPFGIPSPFDPSATFHTMQSQLSPWHPSAAGRGSRGGGFWGRGQVLGNGPPPPSNDCPRYETRSTTRGRGGSGSSGQRSDATNHMASFGRGRGGPSPSDPPGNPPSSFGGDFQRGRGSPRGSHRGGRGGRGNGNANGES